MKNTQAAFHWIVNILKTHNIPFHVAGGLAAKSYGAQRELADIDLDIPEDRFEDIIPEVQKYICSFCLIPLQGYLVSWQSICGHSSRFHIQYTYF